MRCDILTLFPEMVAPVFQQSILKRAQERRLLELRVHQLRDYAADKHRMTDDTPYGGGPGMVLKPEPIYAAVESIRKGSGEIRVIMPSPQGKRFDQKMAECFSKETCRFVFICGHYEGVDARVKEGLPLEEVSVGDFVLTGGEIAAMSMIDASARLVPGVLGDPRSIVEESFSSSLLEYPQYTRPSEFRGMRVPKVLSSGNHGAIRAWRKEQSLMNTMRNRPDLLAEASLSELERAWIKQLNASGICEDESQLKVKQIDLGS
ncbi:MAG: tRNA (guanosine(37)-N1)-methyltransferase TrmD [Nitrospiria bacterium]